MVQLEQEAPPAIRAGGSDRTTLGALPIGQRIYFPATPLPLDGFARQRGSVLSLP